MVLNMKLFLKISFLGTKYCGYQVQNNAPTIQQAMNEASKQIFGYDCDIIGCSRTDSGVHANEFCLTVSKKSENYLEHSIPVEKIPYSFNSLLPDDISVMSALEVSDDFHARYDVKYKEYVYKSVEKVHRRHFSALYRQKQHRVHISFTLERHEL